MNKPVLTAVVAMARNRVIGRDNQLPWYLPADLAHFKRLTVGKPVVMGRRVYDSIGRPLPDRHNIVLSRDRDLRLPGCTVVHDPEEALRAAGAASEVAIIGGEQIYRLFLPQLDVVRLTLVDADIDGDTYFPELPGSWREVSREERAPDERNPHPLCFITLERA